MNKILVLLFCLLVSLTNLSAQIATHSHYSYFGLGEINYQGNPVYNSLSGASVAIHNSKIINSLNPASYTSFSPKSFLLSTGGWHQTTKMENQISEQIVNNNGFSHFIMGFPLSKDIGFSAGILPFSSIGYDINTTINDVNIQNAYYSGDGGISKIYFGSAYQISDEMSIGINASYLFGGLNRRKALIYNDNTFFNSRSASTMNLKGYYYELGLLYSKSLSDNEQLSFGLTANNNSSINAKQSELVESFKYLGVIEVARDTFINTQQEGSINLPRRITAGISYKKNKKWTFVSSYTTQDWSNYKIFNANEELVNTQTFCGGVEYLPDFNSFNKYYKKINYRFGISFGTIPLEYNNVQLEEKSISFGLGLPYRKSGTKYDISFILGQRGTTENNLIKEEFVRVGLNISYNDIWFLKQKYD